MKPLLAYCCVVLMACSTAGRVRPDGSIEGPTSLLGEQVVAEFEATSPAGSLKIKGYATHNPDRQLVKTAGQGFLGWLAAKLAQTHSDNMTAVDLGKQKPTVLTNTTTPGGTTTTQTAVFPQ